MADIQQWRRMIQPTRARTSAVDTEDVDFLLSPTTPKKGLMPKLSWYFHQTNNPLGQSKSALAEADGLLQPVLPAWPCEDPFPCPEAETLMDSIMCRLLARPYDRLDPCVNSMLLRIFESYRNLHDERHEIRQELRKESVRRASLERAMKVSAQQWERERQAYQAEVGRLELIIANNQWSLRAAHSENMPPAQVMRGPRVPGDDGTLETIFHLLERSRRYEAPFWDTQRATMRERATSPSAPMRNLSKTLEQKDPPELACGTPRAMGTLAEASLFEEQSATARRTQPKHRGRARRPSSLSDETTSTFSCPGDLLPDEVADTHLLDPSGGEHVFLAIRRIARAIAKRRNVDEEVITARLSHLLSEQNPAPSEARSTTTTPRKPSRLKTKAGRFFAKPRPLPLTVDTSVLNRKFSFEKGDDAAATLSATTPGAAPPRTDVLPHAVRDRLLRKCASTSILSDVRPPSSPSPSPVSVPVDPHASSSSSPPTSSTPASESSHRPSRIPTPVYRTSTRARPRRRTRDDSSSSLVTAIRHADDGSRGPSTSPPRRPSPSSSPSLSPPPSSSSSTAAAALCRRSGRGDARR